MRRAPCAARCRGSAARPRFARSSASSTTTKPSRQVESCAAADAVAQREPGLEDAGGEHLDAEIGHGAEVGERLHQRERGAGDDRRPRERHGDAQERAARAVAGERGRPRSRCATGRGTRCARSGRRTDRARTRASPPRRASERTSGNQYSRACQPVSRAQRRLHRAGELQPVGIRVGHHIGRHRERQEQRPLEQARGPGSGRR